MKTQLITLLSLFTLASSAFAQADVQSLSPRRHVEFAELLEINLDEQLADGAPSLISGGTIKLDYRAKMAELTVFRSFHCPRDLYCIQMMPSPIIVKLPIKSIRFDACGTRVIDARLDRRPVDGALQTLRIKDHTSNTCPHLIALPDTSIAYKTKSSGRGGYVETNSTFTAEALEELRFIQN